MRMIPSARRLTLLVAAVVPFLLLHLCLAWSVGPIARWGARWCNLVARDLSHRAEAAPVTAPSQGEIVGLGDPMAGPASETRGPHEDSPSALRSGARTVDRSLAPASHSLAARAAAVVRRARPSIFVGPDSVQRAVPAPGRPTSSWTNRTSEHPAGLLIQSPGALTGVIEPGDILVEAEGQPLGSFEQLLVTVRQAYDRRAKRLSGRVFRKGDMVALTVEPGW
jgi:hypothetical protein